MCVCLCVCVCVCVRVCVCGERGRITVGKAGVGEFYSGGMGLGERNRSGLGEEGSGFRARGLGERGFTVDRIISYLAPI